MNNNIAIKVKNLTKIYHLYDKPQDRLKEARIVDDHIKAIYKETDIQKSSTIRNFWNIQKEGSTVLARDISHYNLDMVISLEY